MSDSLRSILSALDFAPLTTWTYARWDLTFRAVAEAIGSAPLLASATSITRQAAIAQIASASGASVAW